MTINGEEYAFTKGRLFLVTTDSEQVSVQQLSVPISDVERSHEAMQAEVQRLAD